MDRRNWNWKNCNWNWKNVDDVSPFLLFESTGDSEAINSDINMASLNTNDNNIMKVSSTSTTYEVDDAQSCCSNLSDGYSDYNNHQEYQDHQTSQENMQFLKKKSKKKDLVCPKKRWKKKQQDQLAQSSKKKEHEYSNNNIYGDYNPNYRDYNNDDDDDDDDGAIDQWTCGKMGSYVGSKQINKNKSKVEPVNEEEKDKLFWDTCLGS